jgi:hypothetical protein
MKRQKIEMKKDVRFNNCDKELWGKGVVNTEGIQADYARAFTATNQGNRLSCVVCRNAPK